MGSLCADGTKMAARGIVVITKESRESKEERKS